MNSAVFGVHLTWLDLKTLWNIPRLYTFYYFSLTCKNNLGDSVIIDFVTVLVFVQVPSVHFNWLDSYPILSILSPFRKDKCHFKLLLLIWKPEDYSLKKKFKTLRISRIAITVETKQTTPKYFYRAGSSQSIKISNNQVILSIDIRNWLKIDKLNYPDKSLQYIFHDHVSPPSLFFGIS